MNFEQLKAKYAGNQGTAATPVATTESKPSIWKKSTAAVVGVLPATNRRVDSIASELNDKYNNNSKELFKHKVMLEMIAQQVGINLPTDADLEAYYEEILKQEAQAQQAAPAVAAQEAPPTSQVIPASEMTLEEATAQVDAEVEAAQARVAQASQVKKDEAEAEALAAIAQAQEAAAQEQAATAPEPEATATTRAQVREDKKKQRRRLGRQAPLAE